MQLKLRIYLILFAITLCLFNLVLDLNITTQISFLIFVLIIFGVPHGALDLYIDQHLHKTENNQGKFLLKYIANILVYSLVWYFSPITALVIFILITAFHFGEIDWMGKTHLLIHKITYTFIGFLWILFLLTKNMDFAINIFVKMGRTSIDGPELMTLAHKIYPITLIALIAVYIFLFFFKELFFIKKSTLLLFFITTFCFNLIYTFYASLDLLRLLFWFLAFLIIF